jgi:hypothetical protein
VVGGIGLTGEGAVLRRMSARVGAGIPVNGRGCCCHWTPLGLSLPLYLPIMVRIGQ